MDLEVDAFVAAEASVGSIIFSILSTVVIALLVLAVIRHYVPLRTTPAYLTTPVFLALVLPCSIILLVPIDIASAAGNESHNSKGVWLPERVILVAWRVLYWLIFLLTWIMLPLLGEYCDSGYRDVKSRIIYSLRTNARYQLIVLVAGIAGLIYFILEHGFHAETIKGLVMALAYAWGLILAVGLMGHGLVALPRTIFRNASVSGRLRRLQMQAPKIKDNLDEATDKLDELERIVTQLKRHKGGASREQQEWIDEIVDTTGFPDTRPGLSAAVQATNISIPSVVTDRYLAELTRKLKRARHRKARFVDEWSYLCQQAQDSQTILNSTSSKKLDFGRQRPGDSSLLSRVSFITPSMRYQLCMNIMPYLRMALAGLLAAASILIIWSEIVKSFAPAISVIGLTIVYPDAESGGKVNFGGQLIAAAWLLYMDATALYAISDVKVWGNRALVKRQTYGESACWYSLQVAKLTVPLSYNFITMLPPSVHRETGFYKFLGQLINLTPLGQGFSKFFPCFLLIPFLATLFNLYGKMKNIFGFGVLEDESEENPSGFGTGGWREGKALIEREIQSRGSEDNLGLDARGSSLDIERGGIGAAAAAAAAVPSRLPPREAPRETPRDPFQDESIREANRQFHSITRQEEVPEDNGPRHFYQDLGERIKNTFDTTERPEWMKNIGSAFQTPKWAQRDQRDDTGGSALSKWFGGRPEDGRLRL